MFMLLLYRYITAYVKFRGMGGFPERFLNLCARSGIEIWDPRISDGVLYGCMRAADYKKCRKNAKKAGMRLKLQKKRGLIFVVNRYKKRYGLLAGSAAFFALLFFLSGFVWNVNIAGAGSLDHDRILSALKNAGVYEGCRRDNIDQKDARLKLLMELPELSWAAINIENSIVTVDCRQTTQPPASTENYEPCNIVAAKDGRIVSIKTYEGTTAVRVGEAVTKGQLLVSGTVDLTNGSTLFKHARSEIYAEITRTLDVFVPFVQTAEFTDEKPIHRRVLSLFGLEIPLFLGEIKQPYTSEKSIWQPEIGGVRLPLKITTAAFYKIHSNSFTIDEHTALAQAQQQMDALCSEQLGNTLLEKGPTDIQTTEKGVKYIQQFICKENIAKEEKILINP